MTKKIIFLALCSLLLAPCSAAEAQQPIKVPRIGFLDSSTASGSTVRLEAFRQELGKLGWTEGKNIAIEYRFAEQKLERLPELVLDFVRRQVDLVVVAGTAPALAAKNATTTLPIVMAYSSDPVAAGLIASLARPGGNVTGLSGLAVELTTKRLEVLKDAVPKLVRVGVLRMPEASMAIGRDLQLKELRPAAVALKLKLEEIETQPDAKGLESAFQVAKVKQVNAIMTIGTTFAERKRIVELASKYRLPAIYPQKEFIDEGGLMFYGADFDDLYRRAAVYVDKILKGAKPRQALRELGYIEGQNISIEYRYGEGQIDRAPDLLAELVRLKVDIILVSGGSIWVRPAKNATTTIPIVMVGAGADPVEAGLVESLARPGGNVTGITLLSRELGGKRLELLKETVAKIARVAVLYDPAIPGLVREVKEVLPVAARGLRLTIEPWEIRDSESLNRVFTALNEKRPGGLYAPGGRAVAVVMNRIVGFTLKSRLPSIYQSREFIGAGGLMSYGANEEDSYRRVAYYVDKILKGAKPAELPVEQPTKFELVINLKTAKQIGLTIPQKVLGRADRVIR